MNILRLSTLSLTLAIAVFSLGYVNPSFADKPDSEGQHGPHGGNGNGGNGNGGTTFSVEVITADGANAVNTTPCETGVANPGTTEGEKDLNAFWPAGCMTPDVMAGGGGLYLFAIAVRTNKKDVTLFFTDVPIPPSSPVSNGSVYVSDRLSWTLDDLGGGSFQLEVGLPGVVLTKAHQPAKRMTLDPIAVGNIVYTPN